MQFLVSFPFCVTKKFLDLDLQVRSNSLFGWFKFTLKPPYSITWQITIGHLGHFLLDFFAQIWTQGTLRHILGPILVIFEICQFLTIPGPFEYFSENG